jgi:hypothetical protein
MELDGVKRLMSVGDSEVERGKTIVVEGVLGRVCAE